jgi:hypothetical protein
MPCTLPGNALLAVEQVAVEQVTSSMASSSLSHGNGRQGSSYQGARHQSTASQVRWRGGGVSMSMALHAATSSPVLLARAKRRLAASRPQANRPSSASNQQKAVPSQQQPNLRTVLGSGAGLQQHAQLQSADALLSLLTAGCRSRSRCPHPPSITDTTWPCTSAASTPSVHPLCLQPTHPLSRPR